MKAKRFGLTILMALIASLSAVAPAPGGQSTKVSANAVCQDVLPAKCSLPPCTDDNCACQAGGMPYAGVFCECEPGTEFNDECGSPF